MSKNLDILLCVGTGRSGTLSTTRMVEAIFKSNQHAGRVYHERDSPSLYRLFISYRESGDPAYLEEARALIRKWEPGCAIIGNGCQQFLEEIYEIHGAHIKLVILQRDAQTCIASIMKQMKERQVRYRWYTAFHFGEMSKAQWDSLKLEEKVHWYYQKTYALIEASQSKFGPVLRLKTEHLSNFNSLQKLSHFICSDWRVPPFYKRHVNAHCVDFEKLDSLSPEERQKLSHHYMNFDFVTAAANPFEGDNFFWVQIYQLLGRFQPLEARATIAYYKQILHQRLETLERLIPDDKE